ncbi:MAG: Glu-tRNA(Gln) amidotransferase subunit GatD [Pyrodictiaceae archaeon]
MVSQDKLYGYEGKVRKILEDIGVSIGDRVRIIKPDGSVFEGILMPRYALSSKPIIVLKLDNGYNVGIRVTDGTKIVKVEKPKLKVSYEPEYTMPKPSRILSDRRVMIIGTGGTIASKIEYETGAVKPALSAEELLEAVPELAEIASIDSMVLFNILSENMTMSEWERIVDTVADAIKKGYDGVIVAHGTDTMAYTAAALSFALQGLPVPVVLVGSQRSSDRPSSDAAMNLISAALVASRADFAEVVVVMHGETGDTYSLAHRATKVRKMHTSRRDAFQSINSLPLAKIYPFEKKIELILEPLRRRGEQELRVVNGFERKVALIKFYPGMDPSLISFLADKGYKGIVLEGTGLGHVGEHLIPVLKEVIEKGVVVVMTSQCLFGRVNMNVYTTGRKLLSIGVVPGSDMLPEVAFVKLSWLLAHERDIDNVKRLMLHNFVGEINPRHTVELYPRWPH